MKKILYLVLVLTLGIRLYESLSLPRWELGEIYQAPMEVYHGRARSTESFEPLYTKLSGLENGNYLLRFRILSKTKFYTEVEVLEAKKQEKNFLQVYLHSLVKRMTKGRDPSFQHFLEAILLGKSWALFREERQIFQYLGLSHLLAMSGLHISLFFLFCDKALLFFGITKRQRNYVKIVLSSLYFLGIFVSPSFARAYIMGLAYLFAELLEEKISKTKLLCLSIWILLMWKPAFSKQSSFLLSYAAIFAIFYVYPLLRDALLLFCQKISKKKLHHLSPFLVFPLFTLSIQLTSFALTVHLFASLACLSFFINLFLLPLGTFLILWSFASFFLEVFHLGGISLFFLERAYLLFLDLLQVLAKLPFMTLYLEEALSLLGTLFFYFCFLLLCIFLKKYILSSQEN